MPSPTDNLTVYVTGACPYTCPECNQAEYRASHADYFMPLDEIDELIERTRALGHCWRRVLWAGGEPLLWPHLEEGTVRLKESGVAAEVHLITAGPDPVRLDAAFELFDKVRVSLHPTNRAHVEEIRRRRPDVPINDVPHRPLPRRFDLSTIPAPACWAAALALVDRRVYWCSNCWPIMRRFGLEEAAYPELSRSIDDDFLDHFRRLGPCRHEHLICSACVANPNYWARASKDMEQPT